MKTWIHWEKSMWGPTQRLKWRTCKAKGRQELTAVTRSWEEAKICSLVQVAAEARSHWHLDFGRLASRSVAQYISVGVSHPVCCALLWDPQETNTRWQSHRPVQKTPRPLPSRLLLSFYCFCLAQITAARRCKVWLPFFNWWARRRRENMEKAKAD